MSKLRTSLILTWICSSLAAFLMLLPGVQDKLETVWVQPQEEFMTVGENIGDAVEDLLNEIVVAGYKVVPLNKVKT